MKLIVSMLSISIILIGASVGSGGCKTIIKPDSLPDVPPLPLPTTTTTTTTTTQPPERQSQTFLWKPASESRDGRCAVLLPARIEATDILVNGNPPVEFTGRTNGHRLTFFLAHTGSHYGQNVVVEALNDGEVVETWVVPSGADRFEKR